MDDLTEIYIYIYLSEERVSNNDVYNDCFLGPSFLEKITCKKKKKQKENVEKFWKKNLKYILKRLSPFFYNSISNDLSYNTQRFDA